MYSQELTVSIDTHNLLKFHPVLVYAREIIERIHTLHVNKHKKQIASLIRAEINDNKLSPRLDVAEKLIFTQEQFDAKFKQNIDSMTDDNLIYMMIENKSRRDLSSPLEIYLQYADLNEEQKEFIRMCNNILRYPSDLIQRVWQVADIDSHSMSGVSWEIDEPHVVKAIHLQLLMRAWILLEESMRKSELHFLAVENIETLTSESQENIRKICSSQFDIDIFRNCYHPNPHAIQLVSGEICRSLSCDAHNELFRSDDWKNLLRILKNPLVQLFGVKTNIKVLNDRCVDTIGYELYNTTGRYVEVKTRLERYLKSVVVSKSHHRSPYL